MMNNNECLICRRSAKLNIQATRGITCHCSICGKFYLTKNALNILSRDIRIKSAIFYYLTMVNNADDELTIFADNDTIDDNIICKKNIAEIKRFYPTTFSDRLDKVMQLINLKVKNPGDEFKLDSVYKNRRSIYDISRLSMLPASNLEEEVTGFLNIMLELNLIRVNNPKIKSLTFSYKGWEKLDTLYRNRKSQTAFIAMSFKREYTQEDSESITSLVSSLSSCEESIKSAIRKAGYIPIIIKDKEHNHSIPEEITYEIKHSSFVVADMTLQNNGAYYEAGLAKGLGKDVIFTCAQSDFGNLHFDTKQINTIPWDDLVKFENDLYKRIKYTIGEYSNLK